LKLSSFWVVPGSRNWVGRDRWICHYHLNSLKNAVSLEEEIPITGLAEAGCIRKAIKTAINVFTLLLLTFVYFILFLSIKYELQLLLLFESLCNYLIATD